MGGMSSCTLQPSTGTATTITATDREGEEEEFNSNGILIWNHTSFLASLLL
jgi:hypothetical protein